MLRACVAELMATFTLTFIGVAAICAGGNLVAIALAHGLALAVAVYATGHISGGHVNPAVTCAMFATRRIKLPKAAAYIVSQLLGAVIALWLLKGILPSSVLQDGNYGATLGSPEFSIGAFPTLVMEAVLTFFLVTTVFAVAVDERGPKNVYGFAIGLTVCLDILAGGPFTGASMNPARSFGPALVGDLWQLHYVYWLGPIIGGCVAGLVYDGFLMTKKK
ncbi:MAG: MIP family channel protein [Planctomycetota bacterium]